MAVESMRGCGYRKIGGLYLVGGDSVGECDRLPFELSVCPCCGAGIKFTRGFTWIQPTKIFGENHNQIKNENVVAGPIGVAPNEYSSRIEFEADECECGPGCPLCYPDKVFGLSRRAGLLWIGKQFYKTVDEFLEEGVQQGISRRIQSIPRGFKIGKTWVFLAHIAATSKEVKVVETDGLFAGKKVGDIIDIPGIFWAFRPAKLERIVKQSEYDLYMHVSDSLERGIELNEITIRDRGLNQNDVEICLRLKSDVGRGIILIPVPDDDPDHQ